MSCTSADYTNTWHSTEILEEETVIFDVKEEPYIPHEIGGVLE